MALAERLHVSFSTVNRWENKQTKPSRLAWGRILQLEAGTTTEHSTPATAKQVATPSLDFSGRGNVVTAVAEATRLSYGHLCNPAFATEIFR